MNMRRSGWTLVSLLSVVLSAGCTSGSGEPEDSADGGNRTGCEALAPPGGGSRQRLIGFAAAEADELESTTGGAGGGVHSAGSHGELADLLDDGRNDAPKIIEVSGTLVGSGMLEVGSNTTLLGVGEEPAIRGFGLNVTDARNIIITNLDFSAGSGNAIRVSEGSHHVWLHHNAFSLYEDDAIEIREGASYVTVAWNRFHSQNKVLLAGHSDDNGGQDTGRLKITFHHNWLDETAQRSPLVRFGHAHVFNNFYDDVDLYGVGSSMEAKVLVQANYFKGVMLPTSRGPTATGTLDEGDLVECGNVYVDSGDPETRGAAFDPADFYSYPLDDAEDVPDIVMAGAGPASTDEEEPAPEPEPPVTEPPPENEPPPGNEPPPMEEPPVVEPPAVEPPAEEPPTEEPPGPPGVEPPGVGPPPGDDDGVPGGPDDERNEDEDSDDDLVLVGISQQKNFS